MHDISELQESIECSHGISDRKFHVDWKTLSGVGFAWLDWLEYNTKRALRIECGDEEEQKLGIREGKGENQEDCILSLCQGRSVGIYDSTAKK